VIRRWMAMGLLSAILVPLMPIVAHAGAAGRKNTAIGLTGAAAAVWLNGGTKKAGRRNTAIALTAASAVAWHKHKKAKRAENRQKQAARAAARRISARRTRSAYRTGYHSGYRAGFRRRARA
jgi:hypothetical protein